MKGDWRKREKTVYDRKKYVDLIAYIYSNNDKEFNWLSLFLDLCIPERFFQLTYQKQILA